MSTTGLIGTKDLLKLTAPFKNYRNRHLAVRSSKSHLLLKLHSG